MTTKTRWKIEASHLARHPEFIHAANLAELRAELQRLADTKPYRPGIPPLGQLRFRYELNSHDEAIVVHSHFINKHGTHARFMRVRKGIE